MKIRNNIYALILAMATALCMGACDGTLLDITKEALKTFRAQWAKSVTEGLPDDSTFYSVTVGSDGSVYAAGYIDGTVGYNFGDGVTASGIYELENALLVKYK